MDRNTVRIVMTNSKLELKVLAANCVNQAGLIAEHGLSFWIRYRQKEYLFDLGQGLVLSHNASQLGIDFTDLDGVFLSHGHYDHGNGLEVVLENKPELPIYAHPQAFAPKYSVQKTGLVDRGLKTSGTDLNLTEVTEPTEISGGLWMTGSIPRLNGWETIPNKYQVKRGGELQQDNFLDDQSVFIETSRGILVLLGCSHAGVVNTLSYINNLVEQPIFAVLGGMHLVKASEERIKKTVSYLQELNPNLIVPNHCTGQWAVEKMRANLNAQLKKGKVGFGLGVEL